MFFASAVPKARRNGRKAMLCVHFDYATGPGCVRTCSDKVTKNLRATAELNYSTNNARKWVVTSPTIRMTLVIPFLFRYEAYFPLFGIEL
jgi:hypothetical protein